jgi:hypothetical protein
MQFWTELWTSGKRLMGRRRGGEGSGSESGSEGQRHQQGDEDIRDPTPLVYKISNDEEPAHRGACVASVTTEKTRQRAWVVVGWRQGARRRVDASTLCRVPVERD